MKKEYTLDDFKETKCCMTCKNWFVDYTLQYQYTYNSCRYYWEHFKCPTMFPLTWQCKYYDGPYTKDCPFGEQEYVITTKEVEP